MHYLVFIIFLLKHLDIISPYFFDEKQKLGLKTLKRLIFLRNLQNFQEI